MSIYVDEGSMDIVSELLSNRPHISCPNARPPMSTPSTLCTNDTHILYIHITTTGGGLIRVMLVPLGRDGT